MFAQRWFGCAAIAVALVLAGCGNVTPGGFSRTDVAVAGDANESESLEAGSSEAPPATEAPSAATDPAPASGPGPGGSGGDDQPEGEVEVELDLYLVSQDDAVTKLNDDEVRVRVDLRGRDEADAVSTVVESTRYTEMRIVFSEIRVDVESGLIINGVPVIGEIRVDLQDISLEVSRPIDLDLSDGVRAELLVDLNAMAWLQAVDPVTRLVDEQVFAALLEVVVR